MDPSTRAISNALMIRQNEKIKMRLYARSTQNFLECGVVSSPLGVPSVFAGATQLETHVTVPIGRDELLDFTQVVTGYLHEGTRYASTSFA